jgi:hypothetical protein
MFACKSAGAGVALHLVRKRPLQPMHLHGLKYGFANKFAPTWFRAYVVSRLRGIGQRRQSALVLTRQLPQEFHNPYPAPLCDNPRLSVYLMF